MSADFPRTALHKIHALGDSAYIYIMYYIWLWQRISLQVFGEFHHVNEWRLSQGGFLLALLKIRSFHRQPSKTVYEARHEAVASVCLGKINQLGCDAKWPIIVANWSYFFPKISVKNIYVLLCIRYYLLGFSKGGGSRV